MFRVRRSGRERHSGDDRKCMMDAGDAGSPGSSIPKRLQETTSASLDESVASASAGTAPSGEDCAPRRTAFRGVVLARAARGRGEPLGRQPDALHTHASEIAR